MSKISNREKVLLTIGAVALVAFVLYLGVVSPLENKIESSRQKITRNVKHIEDDLIALGQEFNGLKDQVDNVERRMRKSKDDSLGKTIDDLTKELNIAEKVNKMEQKGSPSNDYYKEELLEINFKYITPGEMVKFLVALEQHKNLIIVKRLHTKTDKSDRDKLRDVKMTISSFVKL